ncbi:hypothetical protein BWR60_17615 [Inquilinus limosus]|uniref:C-type lysozyme inhibitor domain-containing protein n=2 Tax=Inquilinus limosus TaxID=171674 RepID=A0A211ZKQ2_9PROT|nr:hypothetical protein BWR60_17615 [Inquilinus limosus]
MGLAMRHATALRIIGGIAIAACLGPGAPSRAAEKPTPVDEMDSYSIICTGPHGRIVFSTSDAYGVSVDPSGTVYTYRTGWLSDRTYTYVRGDDVSCVIRPSR